MEQQPPQRNLAGDAAGDGNDNHERANGAGAGAGAEDRQEVKKVEDAPRRMPETFAEGMSFYNKNDPIYIGSGLTNDELTQDIESTEKRRSDVLKEETKFYTQKPKTEKEHMKNHHFLSLIEGEKKRRPGTNIEKCDGQYACIVTKIYAIQLIGMGI